MAPATITERIRVRGIDTFVRRREGSGVPIVFVHGNPTHSEDWTPFLARVSEPAVAFDLPGFGRSERPTPDRFDATMDSYGTFVGDALEVLGIEEHKLVVHDWGVVGLIPAMKHPERVRRLVVINGVPLLPGYRWHWVARIWRRRGLGELFNRAATRPGVAMLMRQARPDYRAMPPAFIDMVMAYWDRGTRDAVLRLYRSADEPLLERAGERLGELACPALVVWGGRDPYLPARFGRAYAERLPGAELLEVDDAGHWPWIDRPDLIDTVIDFLHADRPRGAAPTEAE